MAKGGIRPGAGRPKGAGASPAASNSIKEKIRTNQIIQRLHRFVDGEVDMPGPAVTAALGLLRKVIPDLASIAHSGEVTLKPAHELSDDQLAGIAAISRKGTVEAEDDPPPLH
jgi:hypothetical protein